MYYFDNDFLLQYLEQNSKLQVYVDDEYYDITDASDLQSPTYGIGYNLNGKPHTFDYRAIQQIKAAGNILTIDQLQDKINGVEPEGDAEAPEAASGKPDAGGGEAPGGGMDAAAALGGGEEKPPSDTGAPVPPDEEEEEPPQESARRLIGKMLMEKKRRENTASTGYIKGDFVENIDLTCEFHGSRGVVTAVDMPTDKGGIASVEYRIFNYGFNFKPGQKVTKLVNQLSKIGNDE